METNIQIFTSENFGEIRTCQVNNQIMFVGKDVATALGYADQQKAIKMHVDNEDKLTRQIVVSGRYLQTNKCNMTDTKCEGKVLCGLCKGTKKRTRIHRIGANVELLKKNWENFFVCRNLFIFATESGNRERDNKFMLT